RDSMTTPEDDSPVDDRPSHVETVTLERVRQPRRQAPWWLRLSLLGAVGLALVFPLLRMAWQGLSRPETTRLFQTARAFFEALQGENPTQVHALLATGASLSNQPMNLWFNYLQSSYIDC